MVVATVRVLGVGEGSLQRFHPWSEQLPGGDHWVVEGILAGGAVQVWAVQPWFVWWGDTVCCVRAGRVQVFAWRRRQLCLGWGPAGVGFMAAGSGCSRSPPQAFQQAPC